jgi:mono/diheme cytochrome c family protein
MSYRQMEHDMKRQNGGAGFLLIMLATVLTMLALLAAPACSSGSKTTTPATSTASGVSYSRDIQPLFNNYCVVCHQGAGQAGLALEPNVSYSKLVGVPSTQSATELRVKAGAPDQSYLLAKLNGTQAQAGGSGAQMPYGSVPLSQSQISLVQQWIAAGAPNN